VRPQSVYCLQVLSNEFLKVSKLKLKRRLNSVYPTLIKKTAVVSHTINHFNFSKINSIILYYSTLGIIIHGYGEKLFIGIIVKLNSYTPIWRYTKFNVSSLLRVKTDGTYKPIVTSSLSKRASLTDKFNDDVWVAKLTFLNNWWLRWMMKILWKNRAMVDFDGKYWLEEKLVHFLV